MALSDPGYYDYLPAIDRPKLTWPNGARLALWVVPNIEFYELLPPVGSKRKPWPRVQPDILAYSHCDYGNRVGVWRLMDVLDRFGVRASVSLSVALCEHHPEVIEACLTRKWELFSHGVYNTRYTYDMDEAQERAMIRDCIDTVARHTGHRVVGWLGPWLANTEHTMDLLAEAGVQYTCDLFHDDQPLPVRVRAGRLISVPYSIEVNDGPAYNRFFASPRQYGDMIRAQFDQLYREGADSGQVMCLPLHTNLSATPSRMGALAGALEYITAHDRVWMTTGAEIAAWYYANHYDEVATFLAKQAAGRTARRS
jgi:peptidoglycan/xylan/chitin deacetylase (PgdA/CDA1 family)